MRIIADLHIHSKYSRATSHYFDLDGIAEGAKTKGIDLVSTADFTHPIWFNELKAKLKEQEGIFYYRNQAFILSTEVSNIFERRGKIIKMHTVILTDSFDSVKQISDYLSRYGNLAEDGRPTLMLDVAEMIEELKSLNNNTQFIPAHIWTPWFSLFGSKFGVNRIEEAFHDKKDKILALETGLSSDPLMNWAVKDARGYPLVSNSDAHSAKNLGREANVLHVEKLTYKNVINAIKNPKQFEKTFEFYPQEGKYFWDGHRKCNVSFPPEKSIAMHNICPVCRKQLTLGVLHRVLDLADKQLGFKPKNAVPFQYIIPLPKVIAKAFNVNENAKKVKEVYSKLIRYFGNEFSVFEASEDKIRLAVEKEVADTIMKVKNNQVYWNPGYDGIFGEFSFEEPIKKQNQKTLLDF